MKMISVSLWRPLVSSVALAVLSACGGGSGEASNGPPPVVTPAVVVPSITTQPASATTNAGQAVTFSVVASVPSGVSYQWQRDGQDIAGATGASYTLSTPDVPDTGAALRVVVSNSAGSVTSAAATLTVKAVAVAPTVLTQPQASSALDGGTATFSVGVSGTGPFTYRWQRNGTDIADAMGASYTTPVLALADTDAVYSVVVGNGGGSVTSSTAALTVKPRPPAISGAPVSASVASGQTVNFSVAADGSAPLSYQWQRNGSNIAGATAANYTTAALTAGDSGAQYRVIVSNAASAVTSNAATVTVTTATVAPSVTTAPQAVSVTVGQAATFSVSAAGTTPLSYQWQRNGADISGAAGATYTMPAAALADSGANFSVRLSNAAGNVTSSGAKLTVNTLVSNLAGRAWTAGQLLETNDSEVAEAASGIDDQGRTHVVFLKFDGTRWVLYATRGTPGAAGTAPSWTTPVPIDVLDGKPVNSMTRNDNEFAIKVAPNGNAVARWFSRGACTANTYNTFGKCNYLFTARYLASSGTWEAPVLVGDFPKVNGDLKINSAGDVALKLIGWKRSGTTGYTSAAAVGWRPTGAASFQTRVFSEANMGSFLLDLDSTGNMLMAAEVNQNATTDLVAYRGTQSGGFGAPISLESRGAAATLRELSVGNGGQQIVLWSQNNGTATTLFAAAATSPTSAFDSTDIGGNGSITSLSGGALAIADDGTARLYYFDSLYAPKRLSWASGVWATSWIKFPSSAFNSSWVYGVNRNGDLLVLRPGYSGGRWGSYDAASNLWIQKPDLDLYVLNVGKDAGYFAPVLSVNGVGAALMRNQFDVLPTPAAPAGDGRNVTNLWSVFLK